MHPPQQSTVPAPSSRNARAAPVPRLPLVGFFARVLLLASAALHPAVGSAMVVSSVGCGLQPGMRALMDGVDSGG